MIQAQPSKWQRATSAIGQLHGRGAAWYIAKMFPYEGTRYDLGGLEYFTRPPGSRRATVQWMTET